MSLDDAFVTPVMVLRPSSFGIGVPRPRAALVVRYPGDRRVREMVLRGLLGRGWQLVAAPVGEVEVEDVPFAAVSLRDGGVRVEAGGQTVYDGALGLDPGPEGYHWPELAAAAGEVLVLVTVGTAPILTSDDADDAARAGHLVGLAGILLGH